MQKRITIDGLTYICNVSHDDEKEYWSCANAKLVADYLTQNGYDVAAVHNDGCPQMVEVNKNIRYFNGETYLLKQCEGDLCEWIRGSLIGDFTYYFDKVLFNTDDGFVAAYSEDINNNWKF